MLKISRIKCNFNDECPQIFFPERLSIIVSNQYHKIDWFIAYKQEHVDLQYKYLRRNYKEFSIWYYELG